MGWDVPCQTFVHLLFMKAMMDSNAGAIVQSLAPWENLSALDTLTKWDVPMVTTVPLKSGLMDAWDSAKPPAIGIMVNIGVLAKSTMRKTGVLHLPGALLILLVVVCILDQKKELKLKRKPRKSRPNQSYHFAPIYFL